MNYPSMRYRSNGLDAALIILSFAYLWIGAHIGMVYLDDGALVFGAKRILEGNIPYRDFMAIIAPGYYYLLAFLFKFLGLRLIIERVLSCVFLAFLSYLVYRIIQKMTGSRGWGIVGLSLGAVYFGDFSHYPGSQPVALLFGMLSVYYFFNFLENKHRRCLFYSGAVTALALLFRQDIGIYTFLAVFGATLWFSRKDSHHYLFGFSAVTLPWAAYFLFKVPLNVLVYDLVEYPLKIYPKIAGRRYSLNFSSVLPLLIYPYFMMRIFFNRFFGRVKPWEFGTGLIVVLGLLYFNQARLRADEWHILPTLVPAVILLVIFMRELWNFKPYQIAARLVVCLLIGLISFKPLIIKAAIFSEPELLPSHLSGAEGIFFMKESVGTEKNPQEFMNYRSSIEFIMENVPKGEPIFVGSIRHDRLCSADPLFYFLADRPSATKYHEMHRGTVTQENIQKQIVQELESKKVRYVVLRQILDMACSESSAASQAVGSRYLDRYIRENFLLVRRYGYEFILKKVAK